MMHAMWILALGLCAFSFLLFYALIKFYQRCPSNKVLVVFGRVGRNRTVKCCHGGGTIVLPLIQGFSFLDLTPRTIHIPLKGALSQQNIRVNVPSTFTVAIGVTPEIMHNAAVRLLELEQKEMELMATEIIIGQLRLTVASLTIEEINQDRECFLAAIKKNMEPELHKIGLTLLNVNITDITDESEYIESIGKKASSMAVNQAKVDVAEQEKQGDIGKALAEKERRVSVASFNADAIRGENTSKAEIALTNALLSEKEAEAYQRSLVAKEEAETEIQKAKKRTKTHLLEVDEIVPQEIAKKKMELEAEAESAKKILLAKGEAEAILSLKEAEAEGVRKLLEAKATGFQKLVEACGHDAKSASTMLLIEKLEEIVKLQTEAIKNIKIDKITVWDSGSKEGSTTANFINQFVKSLPALHDITALAGLELPEFLGKVKQEELSHKATFEKTSGSPLTK